MSDDQPTRVALVGCGKAKEDEPTRAADLYTSSYFSKKREYAETCDAWFILSAKHALVEPDETLEPYDRTVSDYPVDGQTVGDWAAQVVDDVERVLTDGAGLPDTVTGEEVDEIVLLAGRDYINPIYSSLKEITCEHGIVVRDPFDHLSGMFEQMKWLGSQADEDDRDGQDEKPESNGGNPAL